MEKIKVGIKLMRIKHWVKNVIILFPMFFGKQVDINTLMQSVVAFFAFSFLASAIYIANDVVDVEKDKVHPKKKYRPIASGMVSKRSAVIIHAILLGLGIAIMVCGLNFKTLALPMFLYITYYLLNVFYSLKGKHIPVLDVVILSSGFIIRLFFGSAVTGIVISEWLYLVVVSGSFFLGLGKRRNEYSNQNDKKDTSRDVLKYYNYNFLDKNMYLCLALTIVFYSLWCAEHISKARYLLFTVPVVIMIAMKYSLNVEISDNDGDPTETILGDRVLLAMSLLLIIMLFVILYVL